MNSLDMDGVPGITQCPIFPNESFVYKFETKNQSGTYWYHSHYSIQYGDGLKGILVIKDKNDPWKMFYSDEEIIELTDWYLIPVHIHLKEYLYPGKLDPVPDTALINGIGQLNCSFNANCSYYRANIERGKSKRFRIINTSIYAKITLTIDQHEMRLIEVDGIYLNGNKYVKTLRLNPGQRYSVLISAKEYSFENYWIRATIHPFIDFNNRFYYSTEPNVNAILQYNNQTNIPSIESFQNDQFVINQSILNGQFFSDESDLIAMNYSKYNLPTNENIQTFIINSKFKGSQPGFFYFNNETFIHPINQTLLSFILFNHFNYSSTFQISNNQIIDVIINNIDYDSHPFHLHGHHVWILSQGNASDGYFNQTTLNHFTNPTYRDTFTVNPYSYILFRFKTDNPGLWMIHCHNDWHLQLGMAAIFIESPQLIKKYYSNNNLTHQIPFQCLYH
jgi:iron transport multicopper oxidase